MYWIQARGYRDDAGGVATGDLNLQAERLPTAPASDSLAAPERIQRAAVPPRGDRHPERRGRRVSRRRPAATARRSRNTVWFRYTPAAATDVVADTSASDFDTVLAVYESAGGTLTPVTCNDDIDFNGGDVQSRRDSRHSRATPTCCRLVPTGRRAARPWPVP